MTKGKQSKHRVHTHYYYYCTRRTDETGHNTKSRTPLCAAIISVKPKRKWQDFPFQKVSFPWTTRDFINFIINIPWSTKFSLLCLLRQSAHLWNKEKGLKRRRDAARWRRWISGFSGALFGRNRDTQGLSDHTMLKAVDYLGSRGAGLLIAAQKLMSEQKTEETEKRQQSERRGVALVKGNAARRKS